MQKKLLEIEKVIFKVHYETIRKVLWTIKIWMVSFLKDHEKKLLVGQNRNNQQDEKDEKLSNSTPKILCIKWFKILMFLKKYSEKIYILKYLF